MKETYNWILAIREKDELGRYKPTIFNYYDCEQSEGRSRLASRRYA